MCLVTVGGNVTAEMSQNGLNKLTGLPSPDGAVSLSPDAATKQADANTLSPNSHTVLRTCVSFPQTSPHAGTLIS